MTTLETLDLASRAEVHKLARLLQTPVDELSDMGLAGAEDLQRLRRRIDLFVHEERRARFRRLASLVRFLPARYAARHAIQGLGPMVSARLVSEMDPYHARKVARHLPAAFIADMAPHVDPQRVQELVPQLPIELVRDAALLLVERNDYVTMGRFADALSAPQLRVVVGAITSDAVLLKTAFFIENREQLSKLVYNIDNERVARIMRSACADGLLPEALSIIDHVNEDLKGRLANLMGVQDPEALDTLVDVAHRQRLWGPILRGMAHMHPRYQRRIVNLPAVRNAELLGDLVRAAHEEDLLALALPLARPMRAEFRRVVAHAALQQGSAVAEAVLQAAQQAGEWPVLLELARHTSDEERDLLAGLSFWLRADAVADLLAAVDNERHAAVALDIVSRMEASSATVVAQALMADHAMPLDSVLDVIGDDRRMLGVLASVLSLLDVEARREAAEVLRDRDETVTEQFTLAARDAGVWETFAVSMTTAAA